MDDRNVAAGEHRKWLQEHKVDTLLARLVGDLLKERPHDVKRFIRHWSLDDDDTVCCHPRVPNLPTTSTDKGGPNARVTEGEGPAGAACPVEEPAGATPAAQTADDDRDDGVRVVDGNDTNVPASTCCRPAPYERGDDDGLGASEGSACEDQREESETDAQEGYAQQDDDGTCEDAQEEEIERPTVATLCSMFPHPLTRSIAPRSLDKVGEGNYGYVLRGATVLTASDTDPNTPPDGAALVSTSRPPPRYAIKVVPIRAMWTLDEAYRTQHVSDTAARLMGGLKEDDIDGIDAAAVDGARHVLRLEGPICYDPETDAVWIPLTWAPVTLETVIRRRRHNQRRGKVGVSHEQQRLFSINELQLVLRQLLLALHFLVSACNLVHLDVKPANILLTGPWWPTLDAQNDAETSASSGDGDDDNTIVSDVDDGEHTAMPGLLLGDYGLLQRVGDPILQLGDFLYMPPEVYWAKDADATVNDAAPITTRRAETFHATHDVWGVGCVLLHMLEGEVPFTYEGSALFDCLEANYLVPMVKNTSQWPPELLLFLLACFERDCDKRPTPRQLLEHPFLRLED